MNSELTRPQVLVIAGYDQSAGAGVLSDVKTLEAHAVYGYAVCTALTVQHAREIRRIQWYAIGDIFEQIDCCFAAADFDWVKIGITANVGMAGMIVDHLHQHNPGVRIVWDPVLRASSGRDFWPAMSDEWKAIATRCYVLTPNWDEIGKLFPGEDVMEACARLTSGSACHVYLKGGHHPEHPGRDYLWRGGEVCVLEPGSGRGQIYPKHGSGCVLSSALAANLALGYDLTDAAFRAKRYVEQFLTSNQTLLGWHRPPDNRV